MGGIATLPRVSNGVKYRLLSGRGRTHLKLFWTTALQTRWSTSVSPAYAGVGPAAVRAASALACQPRVCGGRPNQSHKNQKRSPSAPRMRG